MKFTIDKHEKYVLVRLEDPKLNSLNAATVKSELIILSNEGYRNIILDLKNIKYVDSSGLSSLLVANRLCKNLSGSFIVTNATDVVKKLLSISQLDKIIVNLASNAEATDMIFMEELERDIRGSNE